MFKASKTLDKMPFVNNTGRNPLPPVLTMDFSTDASSWPRHYYPSTVFINKDGQRLDKEVFPTEEAMQALERRKVVSRSNAPISLSTMSGSRTCYHKSYDHAFQ